MKKNIAGLSLGGGRKENFYLCLLDHYQKEDRWFLKSVLQVKDEHGTDGDQAIKSWINQYEIKEMVVDFPLSKPECYNCKLDCPGLSECKVDSVVNIRLMMDELLQRDEHLQKNNPKEYERRRNEDDEIDMAKCIFINKTTDLLLSRPFKKRLKKGYLPYWNRPIDFFIWCCYFDQMLKLFNMSYDSYGKVSQMLLFRLGYLTKHFPKNFSMYEGNLYITLIELFRKKIISKKLIFELTDLEQGVEARSEIIKAIEKKLKIFIYEHDLEIIIKNPRAFNSFLLALTGRQKIIDNISEIPKWANECTPRFLIPSF